MFYDARPRVGGVASIHIFFLFFVWDCTGFNFRSRLQDFIVLISKRAFIVSVYPSRCAGNPMQGEPFFSSLFLYRKHVWGPVYAGTVASSPHQPTAMMRHFQVTRIMMLRGGRFSQAGPQRLGGGSAFTVIITKETERCINTKLALCCRV